MTNTTVLRYAAFSKDPNGGNPAGVVLDATDLSEQEMQAVAAEVGYSETAFVFPGPGRVAGEIKAGRVAGQINGRAVGGVERGRAAGEIDGDVSDREFTVRYFSPQAEVPFCGHATIATGVALAGRIGDGPMVFHTVGGEVGVETSDGTASLTSVPTTTSAADPELVRHALSALRHSELGPMPVHVGYAGAKHLLIPLPSRDLLAQLDYDFEALRDLMLEHDLTTVHLWWRESAELVHARDPFPVGGVVEDAATGAAAAAFGGYLRDLEGPQRFVISQGEDMGRPSRIEVDATRPDGRVTVTGAAVVIA